MTLLAFGINHQTAPVELREQVSFSKETMPDALLELKNQQGVHETAIISTCNRTEVYCNLEQKREKMAVDWFFDFHHLSSKDLQPYIYTHPDSMAVKHLLRVASGLDSMVLGEPQVLGQLKAAYQTALQTGCIGKLLSRLFQHSFMVAKQIRSRTQIGSNPVSVAYATVRMAQQIFGGLDNKTALLIGAGNTIELAAKHLHENQLGRMIIANRSIEKSQLIAKQYSAYAISLGEIPKHLFEADVVISSTASQLPILGKGAIENAIKQRKHKPMFMLDIAVPRDIEPEVGELEDVYLYTIDDLKEVINQNLLNRQMAAQQAEEIIENQVIQFMDWLNSLDAVSTIRALRQQASSIQAEALRQAQLKLDKGMDPEAVLKEVTRILTNRLIHSPSTQLREAGIQGRDDLLSAAHELFNLDKPPAK